MGVFMFVALNLISEIPRAIPHIAGKVNMGHQVIKVTLAGRVRILVIEVNNNNKKENPSFTIAKES